MLNPKIVMSSKQYKTIKPEQTIQVVCLLNLGIFTLLLSGQWLTLRLAITYPELFKVNV